MARKMVSGESARRGEWTYHACFAGDCPRQHRLASTRRASQEYTLGKPATQCGEARRVLQELDDIL